MNACNFTFFFVTKYYKYHEAMPQTLPDFKGEFMDVDFDDILIKDNNPLVNSYKHYIKYKNEYLDNAFGLYMRYQKSALELSKLYEMQRIALSPSKIIYTYINAARARSLQALINGLIITQRERLDNFMSYIETLNKNKSSIPFDFTKEDIYKHTRNRDTSSVFSKDTLETIESGKRGRAASVMSLSVDMYKRTNKKKSSIRTVGSVESVGSNSRRKNIFSKLVSQR
jgi:hypothetical protein